MTGIVIAAGFVGMVLAPCAVGLYSKWGEFAEISADRAAVVPDVTAAPVTPSPISVVSPLEPKTLQVQILPAQLSTSAILMQPQPILRTPGPSLREIADRAASEVRNAQTAAANAKAAYLVELSRTASRRADAAARLAQAAEIELKRATRALQMAEASKNRTRQRDDGADRDYLPHDHPSLDFPRSRVAPHRAA